MKIKRKNTYDLFPFSTHSTSFKKNFKNAYFGRGWGRHQNVTSWIQPKGIPTHSLLGRPLINKTDC